MTPEEHKSYEEAAKEYYNANRFYSDSRGTLFGAFLAGCIHVHKLREDAEREAYNRAIQKSIDIALRYAGVNDIANERYDAIEPIIEELKKLRK